MKNPHFFLLSSRLGMLQPPWKGTALNEGVEEGPQSVCKLLTSSAFLEKNIDSFSCPLPYQIDLNNVYGVIAGESQKHSLAMQKVLKNGGTIVSIGGDHSVSIGSFHAVLSTFMPPDVLVIRVDSHPDILTRATSTTGNIHGMWMRMFLDTFDEEHFAKLSQHTHLPPSQVVYVGNLDSEPEEVRYMKTHGIASYSRSQLKDDIYMAPLLAHLHNYEHIILDIDIDAFDQTIAPGTGIPATRGLMENDLAFLLPFASKICALNMVEVNPNRDQNGQTARFAASLVDAFVNGQ
jgi:arginase